MTHVTKSLKTLLMGGAAIALVACGGDDDTIEDAANEMENAADEVVTETRETMDDAADTAEDMMGDIDYDGIRLTEKSFGPIRIGDPIVNTDLEPMGTYQGTEQCYYAVLPGFDGVSFMIWEGQVVRYDVTSGGYALPTDLGLEASAASIETVYGDDAEMRPNKYEMNKTDYVVDTDTGYGAVFVTDGEMIESYRIGRTPEVEWVEGCS